MMRRRSGENEAKNSRSVAKDGMCHWFPVPRRPSIRGNNAREFLGQNRLAQQVALPSLALVAL